MTIDPESGALFWEGSDHNEGAHRLLDIIAKRQLNNYVNLQFVRDTVTEVTPPQNLNANENTSIFNYIGSHFEASHGALKSNPGTSTKAEGGSIMAAPVIKMPPLPPCCDENGFCQLATVADCCATGTCTTSVPQFMPLELLQEPPPMPDLPELEDTEDGSSSIGRSQFHVQKICCSAEIPQINHILKPMEGVTNVAINVTTKMVSSSPSIYSWL